MISYVLEMYMSEPTHCDMMAGWLNGATKGGGGPEAGPSVRAVIISSRSQTLGAPLHSRCTAVAVASCSCCRCRCNCCRSCCCCRGCQLLPLPAAAVANDATLRRARPAHTAVNRPPAIGHARHVISSRLGAHGAMIVPPPPPPFVDPQLPFLDLSLPCP